MRTFSLNMQANESDETDTDATIDKEDKPPKKDADEKNTEDKPADDSKDDKKAPTDSDDADLSDLEVGDADTPTAEDDKASDSDSTDLDHPDATGMDDDSVPQDPQEGLENTEPIDVDLDDLETIKQAKKDSDKVTEADKAQVEAALDDIQESHEDVAVLTSAAESYSWIAKQQRSDTGQEIEILNRMRKKYQLRSAASSLESHHGSERHNLAQEGFKDTIKKIVAKIMAMIQRVYEFIRDTFKGMFDKNRRLMTNIGKFTSAISEMDKQRGKELREYWTRHAMDMSRYVPNQADIKKHLSCEGKFVDSITLVGQGNHHPAPVKLTSIEMFERSIAFVTHYRKFLTADSENMVNSMARVIAALGSLEIAAKSGIEEINPQTLMPFTPYRVDAVENEIASKDSCLFLSDGFLGDTYVLCSIKEEGAKAEFEQALDNLATWHYSAHMGKREFTNTDLPRLETKDIIACSAVVTKLGGALSDLESDLNKYEKLMATVKISTHSLGEKINGIHPENHTPEDALKLKIYTGLLHLCTNWIGAAKTALDASKTHGLNVQVAWFQYLLSVYRQDTTYLKTINSSKK
jgi:hypothetical protein